MAKEDDNDQNREAENSEAEVEIVLEDEGGKQDEQRAEEREDEDDAKEERRAKSGGESRDDEPAGNKDDENLSPEEREKRKRRREERQLRKQRREEERRELEELRATVEQLRAHQTTSDKRVLTTEYQRATASQQEAIRQMNEAQRLIDEAKAKENWAALDDAREAYIEARERAQSLEGVRQRYIAQAREIENGGAEQNRPAPAVEKLARKWRSANDWYDPNLRDADSKIAKAIDEQLAEDGYNPGTSEYWEELDKRLAKRLPHLVKNRAAAEDADDDIDNDTSPTSGSGRERAPAGKRVYRINADRKAALVEMGIVDRQGRILDKKAMQRMVKRFQDWDKQNQHLLNKGR